MFLWMLTYASGDGTEYRVIVPYPSLPPAAVFLSNLILILTPLDYMFSLSLISIFRHWMEVSPHHTMAGEVCGFFTWIWVFYRAKHDLPVVLGLRNPWEHGEDPWAIHDHVDNLEELQQNWEEFNEKATRPGEDDDDDDDDGKF